MPEYVQKQPNLGKRDDDYVPDSNEKNVGPQVEGVSRGGNGVVIPSYSPGAKRADSTLGDIDDVLNQNDNSSGGGRSPISQSDARAAKNRRVGVGERQKARQNQERTSRPVGGGRAIGSGDLKAAEGMGGIGGFYKRAGVDEGGIGEGGSTFATRLKGINRRRKLLAGGGVGGVIGLMLAVALITPIYRIPALLSDIGSKVGAEVDDIVEARAERMVILYLIGKAGGNPTNYVITGSPLSSIWRTMQSRSIEKKIAAKTGITFQKVGRDVHILHDGRDLGPGKNYEEVQKLIARGTIKTKKDFLAIIKYSNVVPAIRFHKASIEAKSFKLRFLKGRAYGAPAPVEDPAKTVAENATKEVEALTAQQIEEGVAGGIDELGDAITCGLDGEACDTFQEQDPEAEVADPNSEEAVQNRTNGSSKEVTEEVDAASAEAKEEAVKNREGGFVSRILEKLIAKVTNAAVAKLISSAIPYIGWIDLAATLQHALGNVIANDLFHRIPIILKENVYGSIYATWAGYSDQTKAGKMPLPMLNALSKQIGGAEGAQAHHLLYGNKPELGEKVNPKVGSDTYSKYMKLADAVYNNLAVRWTIRGPLEAWYYTIGKLLKLVGDLGADLVTFLMRVTGFTALAESTLKEIFGDNWKAEFGKFAVHFIMNLYGISIDPLAKGAALFNSIFTGAAVALNYHCHFYLGCRTLTQQEGVWIGMHLQQEADQEMAMTSIKDRLFATSLPSSLAGSLLRAAPADPRPDTIISTLFGQVAKLPSTIMGAFSPKLRAASITDMGTVTGTLWWGATPADLAQDVAPEVRLHSASEVNCPRTDPSKEFNRCDADQTVINSMKCIWEDCPEFDDTNTAAPGTVTGGSVCIDSDAVACAKVLLASANSANPRIAFGDCWDVEHNKFNCEAVKNDLQTIANGGKIKNGDSCNNAVTIHPKLLYALYQASLKWKVTVDSFVTTHGGRCDWFHPQGRAMDIWYLNDTRTDSTMSNPKPLNTAFAEYIATVLPSGGEILQANKCFPANFHGKDIHDGGDTCDHIHVSVGDAP